MPSSTPSDPKDLEWLEFTYGDVTPDRVMHARCDCESCQFWAPVFGFQVDKAVGLAEEDPET